MSARGTISCDVAKKLLHRKHLRLKKSNDLELYNKEGTVDFSMGEVIPDKPCASQKLMKTSSEWKTREVEYLRLGEKQDIQGLFSSSHDNDINCYEYSDKLIRASKKNTKRKKRLEKGSWKELREWKVKPPHSRGLKWKKGRSSRKKVEMTWDELVDQKTDTSHDNLNLVYRRHKKPVQRSSRLVDIYKVQSKPMHEPKTRARPAPNTLEKTDIFAQFDEIQAKYNIDLAKSKQLHTNRRNARGVSPTAHLPPQKRPTRKLLRLKPSQQLKLERLIGEDAGEPAQNNLSQYQSLNYSVDPLVKKGEKSVSQKKFKDFSQQIKKRPMLKSKVLHVRNKSSATLVENKFVSRVRPKKIKKISLNDQNSMHSEILSNLREQSFRYLSRGNPRNYFQKLCKKNFQLGANRRLDTLDAPNNGECGSDAHEKDLRIKEYEPFVKSVETESASQVNALDQIELKREAFLKEGIQNKFASHHELFDEAVFAQARPKARKQSLKEESERDSVYNESLKPKRKRREKSAPKDLIKKSLQHKKKSVYKRSILNYTKPKNRKIKRNKDKKYLKDFSTLRAGESFKAKDNLIRRRHEREAPRPNLAQRKRGLFQGEKKGAPLGIGQAAKVEEKPVNSMTLNAVQAESEKKGALGRRPRHYIVNDILEKKGFDLNILSGKNGKKGSNAEFLFRAKPERKNSKSVKISLNNIRSSVAHLEKALAKEKNRLKNICNLTKAAKKSIAPPKTKKPSKRKALNLNLKTKENCEIKSPKIPKPVETQTADEGASKKKPLLDKKKKKTGKLSTKNLLNKFNKMSYFEFKKNMRGKKPEKTHKRPKRAEERIAQEPEWGPLAVSKVRKNGLYER